MTEPLSKIEQIIEKLSTYNTVARVIIMSTKGSAPRKAYSQMLITESRIFGSIGGGQLEYQVTLICRARLSSLKKFGREVRRFALGPSLGQCCGGSVNILIEYFHYSDLKEIQKLKKANNLIHELNTQNYPYENNKSLSLDKKKFFKELMIDERKDLFVWGAGHTGREIISSTKSLPLNRYWIDISRERFPALIDDDVHAIWANEPENLAKNLPNGGIHLILTHSHALDLAIIQSLLKGNKFYKLGLIGSKTKKTRFKNQLSKAGFSSIDIEKIICPIGLPEIQGDEPFRIALSVAGQISNWTL